MTDSPIFESPEGTPQLMISELIDPYQIETKLNEINNDLRFEKIRESVSMDQDQQQTIVDYITDLKNIDVQTIQYKKNQMVR